MADGRDETRVSPYRSSVNEKSMKQQKLSTFIFAHRNLVVVCLLMLLVGTMARITTNNLISALDRQAHSLGQPSVAIKVAAHQPQSH